MMQKRKVCFVITSPIHYSRNKLILEAISKNKNLELQIVVAASALLPRYGDIQKEIVKDGFKIDEIMIMTNSMGRLAHISISLWKNKSNFPPK